ncbi:3-hydroxyacyl-CoA dehydrogenase NAD-binding domain-containing protein [Sphingobacterium sp. HMA12]|uniref:3-hydroxyacyl-CoA dehydrogenase NAD-binding domain-containing protein n=1 Tax=Sphingobacterium sp. HMA12 TaxID=2050894 RepID=UPI000CE9BA29|nr:3-hydroxyacyl-CoA dehydrogenase NAD-binding domain-containing protein [Sphingobacterium sp. HMA12]
MNYNTQSYFDIQQDNQHIVTIKPLADAVADEQCILDRLQQFVALVTAVLREKEVRGLIYTCPLNSKQTDYLPLFNQVSSGQFDPEILLKTTLQALQWKSQDKPIVSIFDNECTGICLATMLWSDYRIAGSEIKMGFPESKFGLFTAFGATICLPQLVGSVQALNLLTQARLIPGQTALELGLLNEVAADFDLCLLQAKNWILANSKQSVSAAYSALSSAEFEAACSTILKKTRGLLPGSNAVVELLKTNPSLSLTESVTAEATRYHQVLSAPETLHMVRTLHEGILKAQHPDRIKSLGDYKVKKIGILGAGMMGSGIAYEAAKAGIEVVLKDVTTAQAEQGKAYSTKLCDKLFAQGQMSSIQQQDLLANIQPSTQVADLVGADLIIEAVFEDLELKAVVTRQSLPYLAENGFFASNTTSLPITALAAATDRPERFIGMHFFSPVDRMPLVEIICGTQTDQITLQKAIAVTLRLGKIPIVVHDGPGFFTSRIFFHYLLEAITMLLEGIPAIQIEEESIQAGFAVGPLAVLDEISLELMLHVYDQFPALHNSQRRAYAHLNNMISNGRNGRKSGHGFYDYDPVSRTKTIWRNPALPTSEGSWSADIIRKRLLHVMALDSYRCLEEGILEETIDGDIGSILGVGYAAHTGGVFGHIDLTTLPTFVRECQSFLPFGEQWEIPQSLKELADRNFTFYTGFDSNWTGKQPLN